MLQPLNDRVLVELAEEEEAKKGGIVLPDVAKEKPSKGIVRALGPGRLLEDGTRHPINLKVGDKVIFSKYGGTEFEEGDKKYTILREDDVYGVEEATKSKRKKA